MVYKALNYSFNELEDIETKANNLMKKNREKFTLKNMSKKLDDIINSHLKGLPQQVELNLPKLKKVGNTEPSKIKLPKLKKVTNEVSV